MIIQAINVTKRYDKHVVLNNVAMDVAEGEFCAVVGPPRSGKSTLQKIGATLLQVTWGEYRVCGHVAGYETRKILPVLGYVPDVLPSYPDLTVEEHLTFFAAAHNIRGRERKRAVDAAMDLIGLTHLSSEEVDSLPIGLRQRLSIGRALVHAPKVLLLDEPLSGLEEGDRVAIRDILSEAWQSGVTVFMVSHHLQELASLCTTIGVLEEGELSPLRNVDEIIAETKVKAELLIGVGERYLEAAALLRAMPRVAYVDIEKVSMLAGGRKSGEALRVGYEEADGASYYELARTLIEKGFELTHFERKPTDVESALLRSTARVTQVRA